MIAQATAIKPAPMTSPSGTPVVSNKFPFRLFALDRHSIGNSPRQVTSSSLPAAWLGGVP